MKATWENTLLAESDKTIVVEGTIIFHPMRSNRNFSGQAIPTVLVRGRDSPATITCRSATRSIKTPPGIIRTRRKLPS